MASPAPPCPCGSGRTLRGRPPRVTPGRKRTERPPGRHGFRPTAVLGALAILLSIAGVGDLAGQAGSRTTRFETELGASVFFGNTEQVTFSNRSGLSRADSTLEAAIKWTVTYGEATNEDGMTQVNRRSWVLDTSLDHRPYGRISPFLFGTLEYSMEKRIDQRFSGGVGGKVTLVRSNGSLFDASLSALAERTVARDEVASEAEVLARWSGRIRMRRAFSDGRFEISSENLWRPTFNEFRNFTFNSTNSFSFALSTKVSLKVSFVDNYDSEAIGRGARTNNDGQLLFAVLARF